MTNYTMIGKFRNLEQCKKLIKGIRSKGKTCYSFLDKHSDPGNPDAHPEKQMENFEKVVDFYNDPYFQQMFQEDLQGLKNAEKVVFLLPAGTSTHIEAGIAYGLGKPLILIGKEEKPESLYLIFQERYATIEEFLESF